MMGMMNRLLFLIPLLSACASYTPLHTDAEYKAIADRERAEYQAERARERAEAPARERNQRCKSYYDDALYELGSECRHRRNQCDSKIWWKLDTCWAAVAKECQGAKALKTLEQEYQECISQKAGP